jgi:hypothetical protein
MDPIVVIAYDSVVAVRPIISNRAVVSRIVCAVIFTFFLGKVSRN